MAVFLLDTYTEASNTALGSHAPDTGGTWVQRNVSSGGTTRDATVTGGTGNLNIASGQFLFTNSATPAGTDYYVEGVWTPSGASFYSIVCNWTAEGTYYQLVLDRYSGEIRFERLNSWSTTTPLGTPYTVTMSNGVAVTARVELTVEGADKRLKAIINGVERINHLDTSALSSVGLVGVQMDNGASTSIEAGDIGGGGGATRATPFGHRGTAFNGGKTFLGALRRQALGQACAVGDRIAAAVQREREAFGQRLLAGI